MPGSLFPEAPYPIWLPKGFKCWSMDREESEERREPWIKIKGARNCRSWWGCEKVVRRTRRVRVRDMRASCECFRNGALSEEAWSESGAWNVREDHWHRKKQSNKKWGYSLKDPVITAVTPDNDRNRIRKNDASGANIHNEWKVVTGKFMRA